jgi:RNA polymerase sigma-70 factor (ECF subfamily)
MDASTTRLSWFKTVILPHEAALRSRLRRLCPAGFDVDNLVAESLARAYTAKDVSRIPTGRGYLFAIARNLLIDTMRRDTIVSLDFVADLDMLRSDDSLEASLTARDELRRLHAIIETLPPQCRRVFILRRVHEVSFQEIAAQMSLSVSTVEKHLARAVMLVAKAMSEREEDGFDCKTRRAERPASDRGAGLRSRR